MGLNFGRPPIKDELDVSVGTPVLLRDFDARGWRWFQKLWLIVFDQQNSGTTAQRPTEDLYAGKRYFDTDLGLPIFYNGADWIDAAGTVV